jgi:CAAX protease family protein
MSKDSSSQPAKAEANARPKHPHSLPWGPAAAIIVTLAVFVLGQALAAALLAVVLAVSGWQRDHIQLWMSGVSGQFAFVLLAESLTLLGLWLFLRRRKASWRLLGFERRLSGSDAVRAVLTFLIYLVVLVVVVSIMSALFHLNLNQKQELGFSDVAGTAEKILTFISLVLIPPVVEETVFRGFLFGGLRTKLPYAWAVVVTSVIFAVPHLFEGGGSILWVAGIDTFLLSLALCYLRERTGALWAGIMVHMFKNGLAFLALYVFAR